MKLPTCLHGWVIFHELLLSFALEVSTPAFTPVHEELWLKGKNERIP